MVLVLHKDLTVRATRRMACFNASTTRLSYRTTYTSLQQAWRTQGVWPGEKVISVGVGQTLDSCYSNSTRRLPRSTWSSMSCDENHDSESPVSFRSSDHYSPLTIQYSQFTKYIVHCTRSTTICNLLYQSMQTIPCLSAFCHCVDC